MYTFKSKEVELNKNHLANWPQTPRRAEHNLLMAIPRQSLVCLFPALANAKNTKYTKHNLQLRLFHFWQSWFRLSGSQSNCLVASFPSTPSIGFKTLHDFNLSPGTTINLKHLFPPSKINSMSTALLAFVSISINWKLCSWSHVFQCVRASVCVCACPKHIDAE